MRLAPLQTLLERVYGVHSALRVDDFLISDPVQATRLERRLDGRKTGEKLLISESEHGLDVALFVHERILDRLRRQDPLRRLNDSNINAFWVALEGVSHFLYLVCKAVDGHSVRLLEMELQAEVDKFVTTLFLLRRQRMRVPVRRLHHWLFERTRFAAELSATDLKRYQDANRYAGKYCHSLARHYCSGRRDGGLLAEVRRFYRMPQTAKITHIDHRLPA